MVLALVITLVIVLVIALVITLIINLTINQLTKMTDNLILYELQKVHKALFKTKEEHTFNFRIIKSTEKLNLSESILNRAKLGLIILSFF